MKKNSTSIVTLILCIVALFIPTYIAIAAFVAGPTEEYEQKQQEIVSITVTDTNGRDFSYTKESAPEIINTISSMLKNSTQVTMLTDSIRATPAYLIKTTTGEGENTYRFYFSTKGASYYEDSHGTPYGITEDSCSAFFGMDCAVALFYKTSAPSLKNTFGDVITPKEMSWLYTNYSGEYSPVKVGVTSEEKKYDLDGAFSFAFDVAPDHTKAVVYNGEEVVYNGTLDGIASSLSVTKSTTYKMEIEAEWYKDKERDYCGNAKYVFTTEVSAQASFELGANSVEAGQIAVINAQNIKDPSLIKVTFTPALKYKGTDITGSFYGSDGLYSALFAIPATCFSDNMMTGKSMKYEINISYGTTSYTLNLDVTDRTNVTTRKGDAKEADIKALRTSDALTLFSNMLKENAAKSAAEKLWTSDKFYSYYNDGAKFSLAYGRNWELTTGDKYTNEFIHYKMNKNKNVLAVNDGKVLAVGENDLLGKFIVIDHGMGLQSWYLHLGEVSVSAGDSVTYKHIIGKTGTTGFIEHSDIGFSMMFTVNGVPVCPYAQASGKGLEETGLKMVAFSK